jgi:plastocyanin
MARALILLLALLALGLAACGGDDDEGGGGSSSGACADDAVVIAMRDIKFDPENATAQAGQEICWPNEDTIDHNVVAESGAEFESDLYGQGESFSATVEQPGTVEYVCTIHPAMVGTIEVN